MGPIQAGTAAGGSPSLLSRISETGKSVYAQRRPWPELYSGDQAFRRPQSIGEAFTRIRRHLKYFRVNYVMIILAIVFFSLLGHPIALMVLVGLLIAWCFLYFSRSEPLALFNRSFSDGAVLAGLTALTIAALLFTDVTSTLITALAVGSAIVVVHGAFRASDDLFLDEQQAAAQGLLVSAAYGAAVASATGRV